MDGWCSSHHHVFIRFFGTPVSTLELPPQRRQLRCVRVTARAASTHQQRHVRVKSCNRRDESADVMYELTPFALSPPYTRDIPGLSPRALGVVGLVFNYQMLYGTVLYFSNYCLNRYYEKTPASLVSVVFIANGGGFLPLSPRFIYGCASERFHHKSQFEFFHRVAFEKTLAGARVWFSSQPKLKNPTLLAKSFIFSCFTE